MKLQMATYISISSDDSSNMFSVDEQVNYDYDQVNYEYAMPYPKRGPFTLRGMKSNDFSTFNYHITMSHTICIS